ncbi:MAG: hypothetical protein ACFFD4_04460 [Candidatus Odinarchaeota archaeon]
MFLTGIAFFLFSSWVFINWCLASQHRRKKAVTRARCGTACRKDFRITITLPRFRLALLLAILDRIAGKRKN